MSEMRPSSNGNTKNYFSREILVLKCCGISLTGQEGFMYKTYSFIIRYCFINAYPFVATGDLFKHKFDLVAQIFVVVIMTYLTSITSFTTFWNREKLRNLLNKLERKPFNLNLGKTCSVSQKRLHGWMLLNLRQGQLLYTAAVLIGSGGCMYGLIKRLTSNSSQDWIYAFGFGPLTVLDVTHSPNYEISLFYQNFAATLSGVLLSAVIVLLSGTLAFVCVQFKILQNFLRTLTEGYDRLEDTNNIKNDEYSHIHTEFNEISQIPWKDLQAGLKYAVSYHVVILEIVSEVEAVFSTFMMALYFCVLCFLCFLLYSATVVPLADIRMIILMAEGLASFYLPLTICFWGERVATESEQVGRAAFEANFVGGDLRFQNGLAMIIQRSQKPLRIKAGNLIETSMVTFFWIVRSSFSYFMVVRNTKLAK